MRPSMTSLCSRVGGVSVRVGIVASAAARRAESERFGARAGGGVGARVLRVLVLRNMLPKGCAIGG
eukprot:2214580-Rhodomonas_salina.1